MAQPVLDSLGIHPRTEPESRGGVAEVVHAATVTVLGPFGHSSPVGLVEAVALGGVEYEVLRVFPRGPVRDDGGDLGDQGNRARLAALGGTHGVTVRGRTGDPETRVSTRAQYGGKQTDGKAVKLGGFTLQDHCGSADVLQGAKPDHPLWAPTSEALAGGLVLSSAELRRACGIEESTSSDYDKWKAYVKRLTDDGLLVKTGPGNSPAYALVPVPGVDSPV